MIFDRRQIVFPLLCSSVHLFRLSPKYWDYYVFIRVWVTWVLWLFI